jgi:hypothetical protein
LLGLVACWYLLLLGVEPRSAVQAVVTEEDRGAVSSRVKRYVHNGLVYRGYSLQHCHLACIGRLSTSELCCDLACIGRLLISEFYSYMACIGQLLISELYCYLACIGRLLTSEFYSYMACTGQLLISELYSYLACIGRLSVIIFICMKNVCGRVIYGSRVIRCNVCCYVIILRMF